MQTREEKQILKVIKGCAKRDVQVSKQLASTYYYSALINPYINTELYQNPTDNKTVRIVDQCVNILCVQDDAGVLCVKSQILIENKYQNKDHVIDDVRRDCNEKIKPLIEEIMDSVSTTQDEIDALYHRVIRYIILINYMGNPLSTECVQATSDALDIVFKQSDVLNFENLSTVSKENQLNEFSRIVCGIRLYNFDQNEYEKDVINVTEILPKAIDLLLQHTDIDYDKPTAILTTFLRQCYKIDEDISAPLFAIRTKLTSVSNSDLLQYKKILTFYYQHTNGLKTIKKDLINCKEDIPKLLHKFNTTMEYIKTESKNSMITNVSSIKDELIAISMIWDEMVSMMNYLSVTTNIILEMKQLLSKINNKMHEVNKTPLIQDLFPCIIEERQLAIIEKSNLHPMCTWYPPSAYSDKRQFYANGYCIVMMVETDGLLMKHDNQIGLINYDNNWFGFTCIQAAYHFGIRPAYYVNGFFNLMRCHTHLLSYFHMYEEISKNPYLVEDQVYTKHQKARYIDAKIQYESKIIEDFPNGKPFNCQCHQTLKHKNIIEMTTRWVQTISEIEVQTLSYAEFGVNTLKEKGTNTTKNLSIYLETDDLLHKPKILYPSQQWMNKFEGL
ncbi:cilia- and flagella-associated protein 206-like [Daktulosphaira vitifoliae]|uniref:cilia- and flagella-associated protein 206-like n=1 Tax=Daktulosphaira vitifoliae TaxID=58002 RepID=UPI0021AA1EF0|nr:cilia- and flagella-associated protein 206-like [Daktulosphaira vitifoliae]